MRKTKGYLVCLFVLAMFLTGCSSDVDSVIIKMSAKSVDVGEELVLTAIGFSPDDMEMELDVKASWALSDPNMGVIRARSREKAVFVPEKEGTVTITVFVGDASNSVTFKIGEKIVAVKAIDFVDQGGGEVQSLTDGAYPYISDWNNPGHWLDWHIDIPKNAYYTPVLMYSTAASANVYHRLSIDDKLVNEKIKLPNTGGFGSNLEDWQTITLEPIFLEAGERSLKLENIVPEKAGINLAWIALVYPIELTKEETLVTTINKMLGL